MRRLALGFGVLAFLGLAPAMFADITDYMLNINGTTYCPSYGAASGCTSIGGFAAASGVASSIDETYGGTGLGSVSLTFNPGPGTYNVTLWIFEQLSGDAGGAGFNEYGMVNGAPAAGQSWQIDVPDYDLGGDPNTSAAGTIIGNTIASSLSGANDVPGGGACPGLNCNDFTSMALGFNFTLGAGEQEDISFDVSATNPGGFSLQQIHPKNDPNDGGNNPELDAYFSGSATTEPIGGGGGQVPEPGSIVLLATITSLLLWGFRSRSAAESAK